MTWRTKALAGWLVGLTVVALLHGCSVNSDDFGMSGEGVASIIGEPEDIVGSVDFGDIEFEAIFRLPHAVAHFEVQWFECPPEPAQGCSLVRPPNGWSPPGRTLLSKSQNSTTEDRVTTLHLVPGSMLRDGYRYGAQISYEGDIAGSLTTRLATLTLREVIAEVTSGPGDQTVRIGDLARFAVYFKAPQSETTSAQWQRNGIDLPGQNSTELKLVATLSDTGDRFRVVLTNSRGRVESREATLTVLNELAPPTIWTPPSSLSVPDQAMAAFGVDAIGAPPLAYQWLRNDAIVPGANAVELALPLVTAADDGARFKVVVSNSAGSVTSDEAVLTVQDAALLRLVRSAGVIGGAGNAGGDARAIARFDTPIGVAGDALGNVFVADTVNGVIRRIDTAGNVTVLAGSLFEKGHRDGVGTQALFTAPVALALFGNDLYVADWNHTLRRITGVLDPAPLVTTLVGRANEPGSLDGVGIAARLNGPSGLAIDSTGKIFVADEGSHLIRQVDIGTLQVSTYAGQAFVAGADDGHRTVARFRNPRGLHISAVDALLVADTGNHTVRRIDRLGQVSTVAGVPRSSGLRNGRATDALFASPTAAVQMSDGVYIADSGNHLIRKVDGNFASTFAGSGAPGLSDGPRLQAHFNFPTGLAQGNGDELLLADSLNHAIRVVPTGDTLLQVRTLAGQKQVSGATDGFWSSATFDRPAGLAADAAGGLWIADAGNHVLRRLAVGRVSTPVGLAGYAATLDGVGAQARFEGPAGIAFDASANLWVTQRGAIRRVDAAGSVVTVATAVSSGGLLNQPQGIVIDGAGHAVVADRDSHRLMRISPSGDVFVIAGTGIAGGADGAGASASFNAPHGVAYDRISRLLYVADTKNHVIRVVTAAGQVSTWAGAVGQPGHADGFGAAARLREPVGLAIGRNGNLYVADRGNDVIRRISTSGEVTTIVGQARISGFAPGLLPGLLARPEGVAVAGSSLYVTMEHGVVEVRDYP